YGIAASPGRATPSHRPANPHADGWRPGTITPAATRSPLKRPARRSRSSLEERKPDLILQSAVESPGGPRALGLGLGADQVVRNICLAVLIGIERLKQGRAVLEDEEGACQQALNGRQDVRFLSVVSRGEHPRELTQNRIAHQA